jgi:hypothetical protein
MKSSSNAAPTESPLWLSRGIAGIRRISTAAKYGSGPAAQRGPAAFEQTQRASTTLSEGYAITLQARVWGFESQRSPVYAAVKTKTRRPPLDRLIFDAEIKGASRPADSLRSPLTSAPQTKRSAGHRGRPREWSHFVIPTASSVTLTTQVQLEP